MPFPLRVFYAHEIEDLFDCLVVNEMLVVWLLQKAGIDKMEVSLVPLGNRGQWDATSIQSRGFGSPVSIASPRDLPSLIDDLNAYKQNYIIT